MILVQGERRNGRPIGDARIDTVWTDANVFGLEAAAIRPDVATTRRMVVLRLLLLWVLFSLLVVVVLMLLLLLQLLLLWNLMIGDSSAAGTPAGWC